MLEGLDEEQRAVAECVHGPVAVVAGAGTGKTRAITHRIAYSVHTGAHDPDRALAVTFTAKAAGELRARLRSLGVGGVQARTFHAAALRQLRYFWPRVSDSAFPQLLSSKAPLVGQALRECNISADPALVRDVAADVEWAKVNFLRPEDLTARDLSRTLAVDPADAARIMTRYESLLGERGALDFEDLLSVLVGLLKSRDDVAQEVRSRYRWFTIDEYQDVNPLQAALVEQWLGGRDEICVVGDPSQTIYSFTGASARYLEQFPSQYPQATVVELVRCYRCTPQIVECANALIHFGGNQALTLQSQRPAGEVPAVRMLADDSAEAQSIAEMISAYVAQGRSPADIAVLYRINAQSLEIAEALTSAGIPITMRGSDRFFEQPEIREAMTRLRGLARSDQVPASIVEAVDGVLSAMNWTPVAPTSIGAVRDRWETLSALRTLAVEMQEGADLSEFIAHLDQRAESAHAPDAQAVSLASLHAAKGLEWPVVFLAGCSDGLIPLVHAESAEELAEERRLLYVGVTRAKDELHLSWAAAREPGGRAVRNVSRFLEGLGAAPAPQREGTVRKGSAKRVRRGPAACRTCGKALVTAAERTIGRCRVCPATFSEADFDALRTWRLAKAQAASVPAYVIFTDATAIAICEQQPGTLDELAAIPGIGPAKLTDYGDEILAQVRSWAASR